MKRLYTYGMAVLLGLSIMLASAGVPLFAHMCNMGCKREVSLVTENLCCKKACSTEHNSSGISRPPCCKDQALFLKKELPAVKTVKSTLPLVPEAAVVFTSLCQSVTRCVTQFPQNNSPPLLSGRELLNHIRILRT
jgi:hypothetical protein